MQIRVKSKLAKLSKTFAEGRRLFAAGRDSELRVVETGKIRNLFLVLSAKIHSIKRWTSSHCHVTKTHQNRDYFGMHFEIITSSRWPHSLSCLLVADAFTLSSASCRQAYIAQMARPSLDKEEAGRLADTRVRDGPGLATACIAVQRLKLDLTSGD